MDWTIADRNVEVGRKQETMEKGCSQCHQSSERSRLKRKKKIVHENASLTEFKMIDCWLRILFQNISIVKSVYDTQFSNSLTEPPPYLIVGIVHFGSNSSHAVLQTITLPSKPKRLNFHSSNQTTFFQKSTDFSSISPANLSRFPRLILFT